MPENKTLTTSSDEEVVKPQQVAEKTLMMPMFAPEGYTIFRESRTLFDSTGKEIPFRKEKLEAFVKEHCDGLSIEYKNALEKIDARIVNGMTTEAVMGECVRMFMHYPSHEIGYRKVADRMALAQLRRNTPSTYSECTEILHKHGILDSNYALFVRQNAEKLDSLIHHEADENYDNLSFETAKKTYLLKVGKKVIETPQYLLMRVAVAIHYPMEHTECCRCPDCEVHTDGDDTHKTIDEHSPFLLKCCVERKRSFDAHDGVFWPKTRPGIPTEEDISDIFETYSLLSKNEIMHASPTMFNAGTKCGNLSSCFLGTVESDSIEGIYNTLKNAALISQAGGAFGMSTTNVRARGETIVTTNGISNGVVSMLTNYKAQTHHVKSFDNYEELPQRGYDEHYEGYLDKRILPGSAEYLARYENVFRAKRTLENLADFIAEKGIGNVPSLNRLFNETANYVDQGGNKRKGVTAVFVEPWHPDFVEIITSRDPDGPSETRAPDLFTGGWMTDTFMRRLEYWNDTGKDVSWSFMSPRDYPELIEAYGDRHERIYEKLEREGKYMRQSTVKDIWNEYARIQLKVGAPYTQFKDTINRRNNHEHIGPVVGTNLCTEVMEVTNKDEIAVCNLASINLAKCVIAGEKRVDYEKIIYLTSVLVKNVNKIIDRTRYPVKQARYSNLRHRPIGLGVMGKTNMDQIMSEPYDSIVSQENNHRIFEAIMWSSYDTSCKLARKYGHYETYKLSTPRGNGSKVSRGILVFDDVEKPKVLQDGKTYPNDPKTYFNSYDEKGRPKLFLDWEGLRRDIENYGVYNSLMVAPMPTSTTSKFVGVNESFEPPVSLIYAVTTMAGTYTLVNKHLVKDLTDLGLWTAELYEKIIRNGGHIRGITEIPPHLRSVYRTVWDISLKSYLLMAHARGLFIDQSQSLTLYLSKEKIASHRLAVILAWKLGLKGLYYVTTMPETKNLQVAQTTRSSASTPVKTERGATSDKRQPSSGVGAPISTEEKQEYCTPALRASGACLSCD